MPRRPENRPRPPRSSCADFVACLEQHDLGEKIGKQALQKLFSGHPRELVNRYTELKDEYRLVGEFPVGKANRMAAVDVVRDMPDADDYDDEFWKLLAKGRPDVVSVRSAPDKVEVEVESEAAKPVRTKRGVFDKLRAAVRKRQRAGKCKGGLSEAVSWVASNIRDPLDEIDPDEVPNCEALNQLMFARENEAEWRRSYDCKRVPAKGFASDTERGLVDNGDSIQNVIDVLFKGVAEHAAKRASGNGGQVRDLPETESFGGSVAVEVVSDGSVSTSVSE